MIPKVMEVRVAKPQSTAIKALHGVFNESSHAARYSQQDRKILVVALTRKLGVTQFEVTGIAFDCLS